MITLRRSRNRAIFGLTLTFIHMIMIEIKIRIRQIAALNTAGRNEQRAPIFTGQCLVMSNRHFSVNSSQKSNNKSRDASNSSRFNCGDMNRDKWSIESLRSMYRSSTWCGCSKDTGACSDAQGRSERRSNTCCTMLTLHLWLRRRKAMVRCKIQKENNTNLV